MQRKLKFGLKFDEITFKKKIYKKIEIDEPTLLECNLCNECKTENMVKYVNCKLKGTKNKQIGYYKDCDTIICLDCKEKIEKTFSEGDIVRFKYGKKIRYKKKTVYCTGKILFIGEIYYNIYCNISQTVISIKRDGILYKLNTCPWCRSHRLHDWRKNTKKFSKIKRCRL